MLRKFMYPKVLLAGFFLVSFSTNLMYGQTPEKKVVVTNATTYTCPMHSEVVSNKPGDCPKCGMKLVAMPTSSIPAEVNAIFTNSCIKCHGAGGGSFSLSKVDFTKWEQYTAEMKAKKAKAISEVVSNGSMPPKSFVKANPGALVLKDQVEMIRKWSETFSAKK